MMYAALFILIPSLLLFPWWSLIIVAAWAGWISGPRLKNAVQFGLAAGAVWSAIAFVKDGLHGGVISRRMAELFALPYPGLIFAVVFAIGFITAFLSFQAGAGISVLYKPSTVSGDISLNG